MKQREETTSVGRRTRRIVAARHRRASLYFETDQPILYARSRDALRRRGGGSQLNGYSSASWSLGEIPQEIFARAIDRPALLRIREIIL